jgi:hypothetical protein
MHRIRFGLRFLYISLPFFVALSNSYAADGVATVIAKVGIVKAGTRALERRSPIRQGDTVTTGTHSKVEFKFTDGSVVALKASSAFRVDQYHFNEKKHKDSYVVSLIKGGAKSVTGTIGKEAEHSEAARAAGIPDNLQVKPAHYAMQTPLATIGVRGTDFICSLKDDANQAYISVYDGTVAATLHGSQSEYMIGDQGYYAYAELSSVGFEGLSADPSHAEDYDISDSEEEDDDSASASDDESSHDDEGDEADEHDDDGDSGDSGEISSGESSHEPAE